VIRETAATSTVRRVLPIGGMANDKPADVIDATKSPNLLNVRFRFDEVRPCPGRAPFAPPVASPVQDIARYAFDDKTKWIVMLTDQYLYSWGSTAPGTPAAWVQATGVPLTGSGRWSWCVGEDCFFFARDGGNGIYRWRGGTNPVDKVSGTPTDVQFVEYFNYRLLAGNIVEAGKSWANRIRYSVNADHTNWTGNGSGFTDFYEPEQEPIMGMKVLNNKLTVFREHSLTEMIATGTLTPVFSTEQRVGNVGCRFPYTIASNGTLLIFLGSDGNVWAWNGTRLQAVGNEIYKSLEQVIDLLAGGVYFGKMYPYANEYWLWLGGPNVYIFDTLQGRWLIDYFPNLAAIGDAEISVTAQSWGAQTGTWEDHGGQMWRETQVRSASRMLVAKTDMSTVMVGRDISGTEDNSDVFCMIETKDYYVDETNGPMLQRTIEQAMLVYNYNDDVDPFEIGVSTDRGKTWQTVQHTPNKAGYALAQWKITGNVARFRFSTTSKRPVFRWMSMVEEFVLAGPYMGLEQAQSVAP
jgi:hypothetical protein